MKVMEIIDRLSAYKPDDHLYIEWWDKETAESFHGDLGIVGLCEEEWVTVVRQMEESGERYDQQIIADEFREQIAKVIEGLTPLVQ